MMVRNNLYDRKDYKGQPIDAPHEDCPCRPCWHIYHFPIWIHGKKYEQYDCLTRHNHGCPEHARPLHIFYLSKRFKNRKKGDKFKCLRCGKEVVIGKDGFDFIAVPFRRRDKVREYLECEKMLVNLVRYAEKDEDKNVSEGVNFDTAALPLSSKISLVSTVVKLRKED